jgi:hypothetical protein
MKKTILVCLVLVTTLAIYTQVERMYWRYWPFEPLEIYSLKIMNVDKKVQAGETLAYELSYNKKMDICPTVSRQLRNAFVYTYAESTPPLRKPGAGKVWVPIPIPRAAEYGKYRLHITYTYEIGPEKRPVMVSAISDEFEVIPNPAIDRKGPKGDKGEKGKNFWGK